MWAGGRGIPALGLAILVFTAGCGGGSGGGGIQPPPPQPDFAIALSSSAVSLPQGGTSAPVTVSVTPENGFAGNVQITLAGVPSGIISNPASPFSVAAGQNTAVVFGAAFNASTGQFSVTAQGTSGSLSHSSGLSLSIQAGSAQNLPRSNYVRNDSVPLLDSPASEPHRRHVVYDAGGKRFFVANRAMNRVEVFASADASLQATIDAPGASSVDLSSRRRNVVGGYRFGADSRHQHQISPGGHALPCCRPHTHPQCRLRSPYRTPFAFGGQIARSLAPTVRE